MRHSLRCGVDPQIILFMYVGFSWQPKPSASKQFLINSLHEEDEEINAKMVCENVPASLPLILEEPMLENTIPVEVEMVHWLHTNFL